MNGQTLNDQTWAGIRTEFTLPSLGQVHRRLSELMEDPEPVMRQLVRVFLSGLLRVDVCPCSEEESPPPGHAGSLRTGR